MAYYSPICMEEVTICQDRVASFSQRVRVLTSAVLFGSSQPCEHFRQVAIFSSLGYGKLRNVTQGLRRRDGAVGIATVYGPDNRGVGVRVPVVSRIFSSPRRPNRLWGPPNLLSNWYRGSSGQGVKLTTHLKLELRSRKCGYIHPLLHTPLWRSA
jgi:hypothetical protein